MKSKKIISGILASVMAASAGAMPVITGTGMLTAAAEETTVDNRVYDGEVKIWGVAEGEVKAGNEIKVAVYADLDGGTLLGFELRAMFDRSKLKITSMEEDFGFDVSPSTNPDEGVYAFASTTPVENDPASPIITYVFKVADDVKDGEKITINFEGSNGAPLPKAFKSYSSTDGETYYKPVVTPTVIGFLPGDTNLNGEYDLQDAILIAQFLLNGKLTEEQQTVGDYNQNGEIDLQDAIGVAQELLKK